MKISHAITVLLAAAATTGEACAADSVRVLLEAVADPEVSVTEASRLEGSGAVVHAPSIRQGEVLGFRLTLENPDETPSEAIAADPNPNRAHFVVRIIGPDGAERELPSLADPRRRSVPQKARALEPGERVSADCFLFRGTPVDERETYAFPLPGVYQVYIEYELMDAYQRAEAKRMNRPASKLVRSNAIDVTVTTPLPEWTRMQNTNVFYCVQYNVWPVRRFDERTQRFEPLDPHAIPAWAEQGWLAGWMRKKIEQEAKAKATQEPSTPMRQAGGADGP